MQNIKMFGLAILAVVAFSAVAVANASAEEFIASKTGKLKGKATTTQEFKTGTGATVDCTSANPEGAVTALKGTELAATVKYGSCTVSGIGAASVSDALYTLFIPLEVSVLGKGIIISTGAPGFECEIEVSAGQRLVTGHSMTKLDYVNKPPGIEVSSAITKMGSEVKKSNNASLCGTMGEKTETTYDGSFVIELEGGTLEVK